MTSITAKKRLTNSEIHIAQIFMDSLAKEGFHPGQIKSRSTQSYTKALTAKFIKVTSTNPSLMVGNCESYDAVRGRSSDLFGILDLIAVTPLKTRGIQACGSDWQSHIDKLRDDFYLRRCERWLASPERTLELWGWTQYKRFLKDGSRGQKKVWVPRCQLVTVGFLKDNEPPNFVNLF